MGEPRPASRPTQARDGLLDVARTVHSSLDRWASRAVAERRVRTVVPTAFARRVPAADEGPHVLLPAAVGSLGDEALLAGTVAGARAVGGDPQPWAPGPGGTWSDRPGHRAVRSLGDVAHVRLPVLRSAGMTVFGGADTIVIGADAVGGDYLHSGLARRVAALRQAAHNGRRAALVNFSLGDAVSPTAVRLLRSLPPEVEVWARDELSCRRAVDVLGGDRDVHGAPDVGALAPKAVTDQVATFQQSHPPGSYIVVVPNAHFATMGWMARPAVVTAFADLARRLGSRGRVVLLPHDLRVRPGDVALARDVADRVAEDGTAVEVFVPTSAGEAKTVLAGAASVVSGRMHACVGALSTGTPCVGIEYLGKFRGQFAWYPSGGSVVAIEALADPARIVEVLDALDDGRPRPSIGVDDIGWLSLLAPPEGRP